MRKQIDYAAAMFSVIFLVIVAASTVTAVGFILDALGIRYTGIQSVLVGAAIWFIVIGVIVYLGMRKAKVNNGK